MMTTEEIVATKPEFTLQDMKKAFMAGARAKEESGWAWQRWMRVAYEARYRRKPRNKGPRRRMDITDYTISMLRGREKP